MSAPGTGYFDVVDVSEAVPTTRETFYDINDRWLHGEAFAQARYLRLDFYPEPAADLAQVPAGSPPPGKVLSEQQHAQNYQASVEAIRPSFVLFRMTWHPNWQVSVDGRPAKSVMLSPGFLGVAVPAGSHEIVCRYEPGNLKIWMAVAGIVTVILIAVGRAFSLRGSSS
jgi:hypothetical protein